MCFYSKEFAVWVLAMGVNKILLKGFSLISNDFKVRENRKSKPTFPLFSSLDRKKKSNSLARKKEVFKLQYWQYMRCIFIKKKYILLAHL